MTFRALKFVFIPALAGVILCGSSSVLAQQKLHPIKQFVTPRAIKESTLTQVPQIRAATSQMSREHENPHVPPLVIGEPNSLVAGSVGAYSRGATVAKFAGINGTGYFPPDCDFAVSDTHAINVVNLDMAFFDKNNGVKQFQTSFATFFNTVGIEGDVLSDPRVFFDKVTNRFFICLIEVGDDLSKMLVAVSDDANPNGQWFKYRIEAKMTSGSDTWWLDYPGFACNKDALVITGNMFPLTGSTYGGSQFLTIPKAPLLTGAAATVSSFRAANAGTVMPARSFDAAQTRIFLSSADNTSAITLFSITNLLATPVVEIKTVSVPSWNSPSQNARSKGSFIGLDSFEGRPFTAAWRANRLVMAHTVRDSGSNATMVRWYEFDTTPWVGLGNPTLRQSGNLRNATDDFHMPAIMLNKFNDITILATKSSPNIVADLVYASRKTSDPLGSIGAPILLQSSSAVGAYNQWRWGDYFAVALDPANEITFWGYGMVANGNNWQTFWNKWNVTPPGGVSGTTVPPTTIDMVQGSNTTGTLADVLTSNNLYYTVRTTNLTKLGSVGAFENLYTLTQGAAQIEGLALKYEGNAQYSGATIFLYLWNWNTGVWDQVKAFAARTTDATNTVELAPFGLSKYVNGAFQVKTLLRVVAPARNGAIPVPFDFNTDLVNLTVVYTQP